MQFRHGLDVQSSGVTRRRFLHSAAAVVAGAALAPARAFALPLERQLWFEHLHTGETLWVTYADVQGYRHDALESIDWLLRDFRQNQTCMMDPGLMDLLFDIARETGTKEPFQVISGYRTARTNAMLRLRDHGVAAQSLHIIGQAIDIRLPDVDLIFLRDAALDLKRGGVGYYPDSDFVHVDTGRVRCW